MRGTVLGAVLGNIQGGDSQGVHFQNLSSRKQTANNYVQDNLSDKRKVKADCEHFLMVTQERENSFPFPGSVAEPPVIKGKLTIES